MRLFISQPMRGKTDEEIQREREKAVNQARKLLKENEEVEVIDSLIKEEAPACATASGLWYLGKSLELLATADLAYFARGWKEARGCQIEYKCAKEYGVKTIQHMPLDAFGHELDIAREEYKKRAEAWNEEEAKREIAAAQLKRIHRDILLGNYVPQIPGVQLDETYEAYLKDLAASSLIVAIQTLIQGLNLEEGLRKCLTKSLESEPDALKWSLFVLKALKNGVKSNSIKLNQCLAPLTLDKESERVLNGELVEGLEFAIAKLEESKA